MSNNIYDILGKLDGLTPKANPVSTAEPIYESVDPRGDIMSAVTQLEERFMGFKEAKAKKRKEPSVEVPADDLTRSADPDVVKLATKARFAKPQAKNDFEAIVSYVSKQEKELERAEQADVVDREKIEKTQGMLAKTQANQDALRKVIDNTDQRFRALNAKVASGQVTAQDQKAAQAAQQIEKDADTAKAAVAKDATTPEQPTTAPEAPQDTNIYDFPDAEKPADTQTTTTTTTANQQTTNTNQSTQKTPNKVANIATARKAKQDALMTATPLARAVRQNENKESKLKMLREYREGDPDLGLINYNSALKAFQNAQEKIELNFGNGKLLTLYDYQLYGILSELTSDQNQERKMARVESIMSNYDSIVQLLLTPRVKKWIQAFPEYAKKNPKFKARMRDVNRDQFKLEPSPAEDPRYDPETDTMLPHPYQQGDSQLEENLGNKTMTKPTSIIEAVRSVEYKKLKEAAKPDFLDLDKDGDTDEPMRSAAKSAKKHEPADIDKDAVAKRKRLQALKDKQEDERAEKGDDYKSASRFVKGRAYGGSAQKDDKEDDDLEEDSINELVRIDPSHRAGGNFKDQAERDSAAAQAAGVRKNKRSFWGDKQPGQDAAMRKADIQGAASASNQQTQAGRIGVATATKYNDNFTKKWVARPGDDGKGVVGEGTKPDFLDIDKDGNKKEAFKKAVKDKKEVEEGTNFGDTIKNSKGKMTKVTVKEGKDAIRNHPIYTTKEAWDHYAEELAEQEMMEQTVLTPVVNVQQELDEIAKLAGLPVKTCEACDCSPCKCNENLAPMAPADSASPLTHTLEEAATRKDFRMVADLIKSNPDREKAKELAHHHADIFKQQNPRFKREMFLAACGLDEAACNMESQSAAMVVGEADMEEGNEFSGALAAAKASGAKDFEVDGKRYTVKEDININVTASGEEDAVNLIRKLSGMPVIAIQAAPAEEACGACGSSPCGCEETVAEAGPKERDVEYTNTPREEVAGIAAAIPSGTDLHRAKKAYSDKPYRGDNAMAVAEAKEESLWKAYESIINDIKV